MTREEAIKELTELLPEEFLSEYTDAIKMAIEALEQEPCDDCIRRSDIGLTDFEIVMCNGDYKEGLKMLLDKIEKAPSVTPQSCGDCISRESVSGCVSTMYYKGLGKQKSLEYILKYVERLPSVTAQQKMGRWIMSDDGLYRPICNNCGAHPWKGYIPTVEEATEVFKYCPNCGYTMQGVEG